MYLTAVVFVCLLQAINGSDRLDLDLLPNSKWIQCIEDGRQDIRWSLHGSGKLHSGLQLPAFAKACKPSKPSSCKWLVSCDASADCSKYFPGELSGREKCLVVINASSQESRTAVLELDLSPAGNWSAIIFGVVMTTLGFLSVVAAGCYSDLRKLAAGDKHRHRNASSRRGTKAGSVNERQLPTPQAAASIHS